MKRIPEKEFLSVLQKKDIVNDKDKTGYTDLDFNSISGIDRFWKIPDSARRFPYFIEAILKNIDPWECLFIWKHRGSWHIETHGDRNNDLQALIYKGVGIKHSHSDIIRFENNEEIKAVALIFNQLVFGWHVGDDIYIVPDHGQQIIRTSHHDVVHVMFKEEDRLDKFVETMDECGFRLPEEIPDGTFKKPDWMK